MWACPDLITGAFRLILAPCSLLPVFPVSGGCVEQGNHLFTPLVPSALLGLILKGCTFLRPCY